MGGAAMVCAAAVVLLMVTGCGPEGRVIDEIENEAAQAGTGNTSQEENNMRLTSNAFSEGGTIPDKYTCKGLDINPALMWEDVPESTKSFALIMDDPDAPVGLWTHWLVMDIPAGVRMIAEQSVPGTEVANSAGRKSYHGPCPPSGTHRYYFKLYALDVEKLDARNKAEFYSLVDRHKIAMATLMGRYSKS